MKLGVLKGHRRNMSKISKKYRHDPSQPKQATTIEHTAEREPPTNYNDGAPLPLCEEDSSLSNLSIVSSGAESGSGCGDGSEPQFTNLMQMEMDEAAASCAASATQTLELHSQHRSSLLAAKKAMYTEFQPWVLRTYGDSAKTKTITLKKCARIIKTLNGEREELNGTTATSGVENSKFRFWVKTKGFQTKYGSTGRNAAARALGAARMNNNVATKANLDEDAEDGSAKEDNKIQEYLQLKPDLFVPSLVKDETGNTTADASNGPPGATTADAGRYVYKRVAIVEQFFDIIFTVHTKTEARNGKHAGQKRTYRAITEKYAFLPREAVTHFLLQCGDCQKRLSLSQANGAANANAKARAKALSIASGSSSPPSPMKMCNPRSPTSSHKGAGAVLREPNRTAVRPAIRKLRERDRDRESTKTRLKLKPALIKKAVKTIVKKSKARQQQQHHHGIMPISIAALRAAKQSSCVENKKAVAAGDHDHRRLNPFPMLKRGPGRPPKNGACSAVRPPLDEEYCLPFTTTYLRQQRARQNQNKIQIQNQNQDQGTQTPKIERSNNSQFKEGGQDKQNAMHLEEVKVIKEEKSTPINVNIDEYEFIPNHDYGERDKDDETGSVSSSIKAEVNSDSSDEEDEFESDEDNDGGEEHGQDEKAAISTDYDYDGSRMVKMSGASGRKRLAPTKLTAGGKAKSSKGPGGAGDPYAMSLKESEHEHFSSGSGDGSSADENQDHSHGHGHGHGHGAAKHGNKMLKSEAAAAAAAAAASTGTSPIDCIGGYHTAMGRPGSSPTITNNNNIFINGKHDSRKQSSPISLSERSVGTNSERERDENSSNGNKDDEDDDDEDSLDKADAAAYDPERLKAFNMFVRLFVDENLDRMVPISKQPKEKIQAIIDSCTRQFPEYAERARKRIRTYLKSCRRNKRIKDTSNGVPVVGVGWESTRPTPAHLTSAQAEQILAQACENESQNAKRMRMGLEPISQPLPSGGGSSNGGSSGRLVNEVGNGCMVSHLQSHSASSTPSPEKMMKLSTRDSSRSTASPSPSASTPGAVMPSPTATAASISAVVAAAVASANSTCSSLSSPSSGISSLSAFSDATTASTPLNGAPHINLLSTVASNVHHAHSHLVNGTASPSLAESPLMNSTSMTGLSKLVGAERGNHVVDYSRRLNGSAANVSMYKPNFCQSLSKPGQFPGSLFPSANGTLNGLNGEAGPTDLSMKSKSPSATSALLTQHLNITELATVRQLIIGYRESAAFLLRSADELEQLLLQQQ